MRQFVDVRETPAGLIVRDRSEKMTAPAMALLFGMVLLWMLLWAPDNWPSYNRWTIAGMAFAGSIYGMWRVYHPATIAVSESHVVVLPRVGFRMSIPRSAVSHFAAADKGLAVRIVLANGAVVRVEFGRAAWGLDNDLRSEAHEAVTIIESYLGRTSARPTGSPEARTQPRRDAPAVKAARPRRRSPVVLPWVFLGLVVGSAALGLAGHFWAMVIALALLNLWLLIRWLIRRS